MLSNRLASLALNIDGYSSARKLIQAAAGKGSRATVHERWVLNNRY